MKTIGLIGGTSWQSTAVYYRLLNEGVAARLGGLHSASLILASVDFAPFAEQMGLGRWEWVAEALVGAARQVAAGGADCLALCTNTMHKVARQVEAATPLPFVNLMDVTGEALSRQGVGRPLLLATRYTMEQEFYRGHLHARFGIDAAIPDEPARAQLQSIIFDELCCGTVRDVSRAAILAMVAAAERQGCDGVIFGCTEIRLLLTPADLAPPVFDTTQLHCDSLLDVALASLPLQKSHTP